MDIQLNLMNRFGAIAKSFTLCGIGVAIGGLGMHLTGMSGRGNLTFAFIACLLLAAPEWFLVRRYSLNSPAFRLDGEVFTFFSVGVAAAILIF